MTNLRIGRAMAAGVLLAAVGAFTPVTASADPVVPCGARSTPVGSYINLTYKNCTGSGQAKQPYRNGQTAQSCKHVAAGQWVSWTQLPGGSAWTAIDCLQ